MNISEKEREKPKIDIQKEEIDEPIIYKRASNYIETSNNISSVNINSISKKKMPLKWKIVIITSVIIIICLIIALILYFVYRSSSSPQYPSSSDQLNLLDPSDSLHIIQPLIPQISYIPEDLVSGLTYQKNQIMRFQNKKTTNIIFDFLDINTENNSKKLIEYFDYVIGIIDQAKVYEDNIEKDVFSGFIFLENYLIDNETDKVLLHNSSILEENGAIRNIRNLEDKKYFNFSLEEIKSYYSIDNETLPLMKFDFYRNGKISRIYKPKNLSALVYDQMLDILEKIIPKIARKDFNNTYSNISKALEMEYEKIRNRTMAENEEEDDDFIEIEEENEAKEENVFEMNEEDKNLFLDENKEIGDQDDFNDLIDQDDDIDQRRLSGNRVNDIKNNFRK